MCANTAKYSSSFQPIEAKSTLIVSPASIAKQWLNEIKKHTAPGTIKAVVSNTYNLISIVHMFVEWLLWTDYSMYVCSYMYGYIMFT